jgi:hypothetical protein
MGKYLVQPTTINPYQAMIHMALVQALHRSNNCVRHTHKVYSNWPNVLQYQEVNLDDLSAHVLVDVHLITKPTCTCGRFEVNHIPCGHAIACLRMLNQAPRDHVPEFFSLVHYYYTYEKNVQPVNVTALEAQAIDKCSTNLEKKKRKTTYATDAER